MAKRIDRARIDAGKVQLPRRLNFLTEQKVDYLSVTDRDGDFTVELSAAALSKLVKARSDLKTLKAGHKSIAADHQNVLTQEREAHEATRRELASAQRKLKKLQPEQAAPAKKASTQARAKNETVDAQTSNGAQPKAARKRAPKAAAQPAAAAPLTGEVDGGASSPVSTTAAGAAPVA